MTDKLIISGDKSKNAVVISQLKENNRVNINGENGVNSLEAINNNAKYYTDKAKEYANQAEQSAINSANSAEQAQASADSILLNESFIAVNNNLETINTVANSIENVDFVGENIEQINQLVDDLEALGDTTNIATVATNISSVNTTAENIEAVKNVSNNTDDIDVIVNNLSNINYVSENIEDIQTVATNKDIVLEKVEEAKGYAESASSSSSTAISQATIATEKAQESLDYSELSKQWAISDAIVENIDYSSKHYAEVSKTQAEISTSKTNEVINSANVAISDIETLADNTKTEIETLGNEKIDVITVQTEIAITKASEASQSASNALKSAENSAISEANAKESETNALTYSNNANNSTNIATEKAEIAITNAEIAVTQASNALASASNAKTSETNALTYSNSAQSSANIAIENANTSAINAENSMLNAETASKKANEANTSASNAENSENNALNYSNSALSSANIATEQAQIATEQANIAKEEVTKLTNVYKFKGSVASFSNLPISANIGDVYDTLDTGMNYAWTGDKWDELGGTFEASWGNIQGDISNQADLQNALNSKQDKLTAGENITIENNVISASGGSSVDLTGYIKNATAMSDPVAIGTTTASYESVSIGSGSYCAGYSVAVGNSTNSGMYAVAIGRSANASKQSAVAIGNESQANTSSIAIGNGARATADYSIQIGDGLNSTSSSFQINSYKMLDLATGKIPVDRIPDEAMGGSGADVDLSNLSATGQAKFDAKADVTSVLNKTQITNCLLEVPEKIKYTLQNGVLTFKAGSVFAFPMGTSSPTHSIGTVLGNIWKIVDIQFENSKLFYWCELTKDTAVPVGSDAVITDRRVVFPSLYNSSFPFIYYIISAVTSGTEPLTTSGVSYLSNSNIVGRYVTSGWSTSEGMGFPVCIAQGSGVAGGGFASIDEVFNGFGFIGHHTFSYEGIKSLIPNGKNPDGTLKNIETITTSINVRDEANRGSLICFWDGTNILTYGVNNYFEQDAQPTFSGQHCMWLNTKENIMYSTSDSGATWVVLPRMYLGRLKKTTGAGDFVDASFKTPVELVKKAEFNKNITEINSDITAINSSINTINSKVSSYPKLRNFSGKLLNASGDTTIGYGTASILLYSNGRAEVQFALQITTAGTASDVFTWGINRDFLKNAGVGIPSITPVAGGIITYFRAGDGTIDNDIQGYGGTFNANNQFWVPSRVYNTSGSVGGWNSSKLAVTKRMVGICYGTYTVGSES